MKIVILTDVNTGYTLKRLREEAVSRGHECTLIDFPGCYVDIQNGVQEILYEGHSLNDVDAVINHIPARLVKYGAAIARQFEIMGLFVVNHSLAIVRAQDKLRSLQLQSKAGVRIPRTVFSLGTDAVDDLIEQIGVPMIIKVARSSQGNGVVLAETRKAAKSVIQAFYVENVSILLQEFIPESGGADIRVFVVGSQVVASYKRQSLDDDYRANPNPNITGTSIKLTDEEKKTALKAARAMGLQICVVDLIRSDRGPLVIEVNPSPGLEMVEKVTGRNVAGKIIEYVEQNARKSRRKDRVGA